MDQQTSLYNAIIANNDTIVNQLLNEGFNPNMPLLYGYSALYWSIMKGNIKIVKLIMNKNYFPTDTEIIAAKEKGKLYKEIYDLVIHGQNNNLPFVIEI
jgi:ankyrin repeat protein